MIRDISPPIRPGIVNWPGDTPFGQEPHLRLSADCPVNVARVTLSSHTGAHVDAPLHYRAQGTPIGGLDLAAFIGPCRVVDLQGRRGPIRPRDILPALSEAPPRILLRTYAHAPQAWDPQFASIAAETIKLLAQNGVVLVGIDTPSIDPGSSKTLEAHHAAYMGGVAILEGLRLDGVPAGDYELLALPINLADLDAAPVRAVLRDLP